MQQFLPIFIISFGVFVLFFIFMAVGYIVQKKPLKGSCGGVAAMMGDESCQFCGGDPNKCDSLESDNAQAKKAAALGKKV